MKQYAVRCELCGAETQYFPTSAELRNAWDNGEFRIRKSDVILVRCDALQAVCKLRNQGLCNLDCGHCPNKTVRELRQMEFCPADF